jgi:hypothetical protein
MAICAALRITRFSFLLRRSGWCGKLIAIDPFSGYNEIGCYHP